MSVPGSTERSTVATDAELVARCRTGDQGAWRLLVERHAPLVTGLLRGAFRLELHDAEDAFQEVFTRLYLRLDSVRDDQAIRAWIAQVTRNVALDWLRRSRPEATAGEELQEHTFTEPLAAVEQALIVREALNRLPHHHAEILERFFVQDQSYREIAAELDLPAGTIASRISRALAALRREWESGEDRRAR
jgi:RNA polymerase sigma-70 factor (ECF subfamily)